MVMPTENFVRLAQARDDLLMQRSAWADECEFVIAQKLRIEAIEIIEDGTRDWAFESWLTKQRASGRRFPCDQCARIAYRIDSNIWACLCVDQPVWMRVCHAPNSHYVLMGPTIALERS